MTKDDRFLCHNDVHNDIAERASRNAREKYAKELWDWCLINGVKQHGDLIALPKDPMFPLKLIKKIAEMHYVSSQEPLQSEQKKNQAEN